MKPSVHSLRPFESSSAQADQNAFRFRAGIVNSSLVTTAKERGFETLLCRRGHSPAILADEREAQSANASACEHTMHGTTAIILDSVRTGNLRDMLVDGPNQARG